MAGRAEGGGSTVGKYSAKLLIFMGAIAVFGSAADNDFSF
jgi:hypothetical protein